MEFFKQNTQIDFMGARYWAATFSIFLFLFSTFTLITKGLNWGLEFTGGTQIELSFPHQANLEQIRNQLSQAGFPQAIVQNYGSSKEVLINIVPKEGAEQEALVNQILSLFKGAEKKRVEYIGPQVGNELFSKGMLALFLSLLGTMVYIAFRFEYRFAISSAIALIHDPMLIIGTFSFFQLEFDLKALAALLAVIGYSLNDTIVVFDRVRENFKKLRRKTPSEIMNLSINQTLSRTIMTSVLTLLVIVALFIHGGETLRGFALTVILGILIGTYSSIYIAGSLAIAMGLSKSDLLTNKREYLDDRP